MILAHLLAEHLLGDQALVETLLEQTEEERLLIGVGVALVVAEEGVVAEELATRAHHPRHRREEPEALRGTPVHLEAGLPGLGPAAGVVDHLRLGGQAVEVVPLALADADGRTIFELEADPGLVVALEAEHLPELLLDLPVGELRAVEQHDAAREHAVDVALRAGAVAAADRLVFHVTRQQLPDVAHREDVGIHDHRPARVAHELGGHEAERGEGLEILVEPRPLHAVAQILLPVELLDEGVILGADELDVELVGVPGVTAHGVLGDPGAHDLLVIGVDEDAMIRHGPVSALHWEDARATYSPDYSRVRAWNGRF